MGSAARMGLLGGERRAMKSSLGWFDGGWLAAEERRTVKSLLGWCDGDWLAAGKRRAMKSPAYGAAPDESGLGAFRRQVLQPRWACWAGGGRRWPVVCGRRQWVSTVMIGLLAGERRAMVRRVWMSPVGQYEGDWFADRGRRAMNSPAYGAAPDESGFGPSSGRV